MPKRTLEITVRINVILDDNDTNNKLTKNNIIDDITVNIPHYKGMGVIYTNIDSRTIGTQFLDAEIVEYETVNVEEMEKLDEATNE